MRFCGMKVIFLRYTISAEGTRPLEKKDAAINRFKQLAFVNVPRGFLGVLNFYRRFKPQVANIQTPIHATFVVAKFKGSQSKDQTPTIVHAFHKGKVRLYIASLLAYLHPCATVVYLDASHIANGAALQQRVCNRW
jgi:hypothetical protein